MQKYHPSMSIVNLSTIETMVKDNGAIAYKEHAFPNYIIWNCPPFKQNKTVDKNMK
tara:strand:- start:699 stop:866 length:168 start_codon:yes stop_codon:yes gene_type:complete